MLRWLSSAVVVSLAVGAPVNAQQGEGVRTQALVTVVGKSPAPTGASDVMVTVAGHKQPLSAWAPVAPANAQVALLIDDGLRESIGRNLSDIQNFLKGLPQGMEVLIGYMQNGTVMVTQPFTTDHESAAASIRLPQGIPGESASPYFCLSDFVKKWPGADQVDPNAPSGLQGTGSAPHGKARFVMMITNGVDPYNGSTSVMNQDSPYVNQAITDSQRAGVAVYSIYFTDAGIRGGSANMSGQSYLEQVTQATGGRNYYEGIGNLVDMAPFLKEFVGTLGRTYVATFEAPPGKNDRDLVQFKIASSVKRSKLRGPQEVLPGNAE